MSTALLLFFEHNEPEGTVPVNSYVCPDTYEFIEEVNSYLTNIIQSFLVEIPPAPLFFLKDESDTDLEEEDWDGFTYADQLDDDKIQLPDSSYDAAVLIAKNIVSSDLWENSIIDADYSLTGFAVDDIAPAVEPIDISIPVDPRYEIGDVLLSAQGRRFTYKGVHYDPLYPYYSSKESDVNYDRNTVRLGVEAEGFVKETEINDFIETNEINIYPLPRIAMANLPKGLVWFARLESDHEHEGYGANHNDAKKSLALREFFSR